MRWMKLELIIQSEVSQKEKHQNSTLSLLSHFSHVPLCAIPWTAAHQAPQSLGFSRQEHWRGLPFLSPMQESEKWKWSCSVMSDPQRPHGLQHSRLLHPWGFPGKSTGMGCHWEFRKMVMITLYVRQQKRHRCIEQTFGLCGRGRGWDDLGECHGNMYHII